jgi:hypothetical protein
MMNKENHIVSKKASVIKIAIDMHLRSYRVVRQMDQSTPQPAQKFGPQAFYPLAGKAAPSGRAGGGML